MLPKRVRPRHALRVASGPAILGQVVGGSGLVFSGSEEETVSAFNVVSLVERWRAPSDGAKPDLLDQASGVLLVGDALGGMCRGLNAADGETLWQVAVSGPALGCWRGNVIAELPAVGLGVIDLRAGETIATVALPSENARPQAVIGDMLVFGPRGRCDPFGGLDLSSGEVLWERETRREAEESFGARLGRSLSLVEGVGGAMVGVSGESVLSLAASTGEIRWHAPVTIPNRNPNVEDDAIYAWARDAAFKNHFVCLSGSDGSTIYDQPLSGSAGLGTVQDAWRGAAAGDSIAFATQQGQLAVFCKTNGELSARYSHSCALFAPAFLGNRLFVPAEDGALLVFEGAEL